MGSPVSNRQKILDCARELFYQVGYQATSVDDILQQSGVAKSNFYYHFKTKDDLAFAVLDLQVAQNEALILRSLQNTALTPSRRLGAFFAQLCHIQAEVAKMGGCPFGNLAAALPNSEGDARNERFRSRLSGLFRSMQEALRECLLEGSVRGEFRSDITAEELAAFLLATIEGLMILAKTHKDAQTLVTGFAVVERLLQVL
jgi:TetR/AcrR family transcriptional repressor of nem operon